MSPTPGRREERAEEPRGAIAYWYQFREWVLLTGGRWSVALGLQIVLLGVIVTLFEAEVIGVSNSDAVTRGFAALVAGNLTLVTIVISINQLILSREFGTPAELQEQIERMVEYRRRAEETIDAAVSPVSPNEFLDFLVHALRDHALALESEMGRDGDHEEVPSDDVAEFLERVLDQTGRVRRALEEPSSRGFPVMLAILDVDFSDDLHAVQWIQTAHHDRLSGDATEALEDVRRVLELIGAMRQYLETLYLQRELADLSRELFYVGIPAVVLSLLTIWLYGRGPEMAIGRVGLQAVVAVTAVVALGPLAVFFAHITRIATITTRSASLMPFRAEDRR